jgi:hypothetical protein
MTRDWLELTRITQGAPLIIERVRLSGTDIAIEGEFELPALARLSAEDQVFIMAFVRSDGSIKEMEKVFGISYPTVKNRLRRISEQIEFVETSPPPSQSEVMAQLEQGEISAAEAIERLSR